MVDASIIDPDGRWYFTGGQVTDDIDPADYETDSDVSEAAMDSEE